MSSQYLTRVEEPQVPPYHGVALRKVSPAV